MQAKVLCGIFFQSNKNYHIKEKKKSWKINSELIPCENGFSNLIRLQIGKNNWVLETFKKSFEKLIDFFKMLDSSKELDIR